MFVSFDGQTLILRKMVKQKVLHAKPSLNIMYPKEEKVFMVPNRKKIGDYYEN